jgi:hypothetical protein
MNRDEIERLKEEEKAHLRKVRALKQQLREANRKKGLLDALKGLDTSALDATHEEMLRKVTEKNVTSEARFELAMEALDEAEKQEATRQEMARIEAERQKKDAADLVRQMKTQMLGDAEASNRPPATDAKDDTDTDAALDPTPAKTIGPAGGPDAPDRPEPEADDAPPARSIGRFSGRRDTERD